MAGMRCEECRQEFVEESPRDLLALYFHLMLEHGFIGLLSRKKVHRQSQLVIGQAESR